MSRPLFTRGTANAKTKKALTLLDVDTLILHLAPAKSAGVGNMCPFADGCEAPCLNTSGRGGIFKDGETTNAIQEARIRKTRDYVADPDAFIARLSHEIERAKRRGAAFIVRPNGTSDQPRIGMRLAAMHPDVTFYDYTAIPEPWKRQRPNYSLTFSRKVHNDAACFEALAHGVNVAVVFDTKKGQPLPTHYYGVRVVDGDETDLRFMDPQGVVVGLRAKGKAKHDHSGFVVRTASLPLADRKGAA